jgi:hypothetical protein
VNTLFTARAGLPVNVYLTRNANEMLDGNNANQRPNRLPGIPIYLPTRSTQQWINPAAFSLPAVGAWGNSGRNIAAGPALWQNDSAIEKTFRLTERNNVIFRTEAFNFFNRAQYANPSATLSVNSVCPASTPANPVTCTPNNSVRTLNVPASFAKITSTVNSAGLVGTGTPRVLEFSLRVTY